MADGTSDDFDDNFVDASDFERRRDTEDTGDDEGQEESTDDEDPGPQVKRRGKDLIWVEVERFQHQDDFEQSALWAEIKETMSSTRNSRNDEAQFKQYRCKYKRKGGWLPCDRSYKVGSHLY